MPLREVNIARSDVLLAQQDAAKMAGSSIPTALQYGTEATSAIKGAAQQIEVPKDMLKSFEKAMGLIDVFARVAKGISEVRKVPYSEVFRRRHHYDRSIHISRLPRQRCCLRTT